MIQAHPPLIVVAGVSGCGKSTVGAALAKRLGVSFCEGDAYHDAANIAKMAAGIPLTDEDRFPWLSRIGKWLRERSIAGDGGVASCSALRLAYRDHLAAYAPGMAFVFCEVPRSVLARRLADRPGHFMPAALLDSQLTTLEPPGASERAIGVDATLALDVVTDRIVSGLAKLRWQ